MVLALLMPNPILGLICLTTAQAVPSAIHEPSVGIPIDQSGMPAGDPVWIHPMTLEYAVHARYGEAPVAMNDILPTGSSPFRLPGGPGGFRPPRVHEAQRYKGLKWVNPNETQCQMH